jgi:hypothetical protein
MGTKRKDERECGHYSRVSAYYSTSSERTNEILKNRGIKMKCEMIGKMEER